MKKKLQILVPQYKETEDIIKPLLDSIEVQQNVDLINDIGVIIVKVFKTSIIATLILCVIMSIVGASVEKSGRKSYSYIEKDGIRTYEKDYYFDYD